MRMLAVYHKLDSVRFVSHLDVLRALQRAFRRAKLPLKYSEGFNPHPEMSFVTALSTGMTSDAEWFEVELEQEMDPLAFQLRVNGVLPKGFYLSDAQPVPAGLKTLTNYVRGAEYRITMEFDEPVEETVFRETLDSMLTGEIIVNKRTKSGIKPVDIRPQILKTTVVGIEGKKISLLVLGRLQADGGLRAELFAGALFDRLSSHGSMRIHRTAMYFETDGSLPRMPLE